MQARALYKKFHQLFLLTFLAVFITACGGGGGGGGDNGNERQLDDPPQTYKIQGSATGLSGDVTLSLNEEQITVSSNELFSFLTGLPEGTVFNVTIIDSGAEQQCEIINGSGTIGQADVNVVLQCSPIAALTFFLGGEVSNLTGELRLSSGTGETLSVTNNGAFSFTAAIATGTDFNVSVETQPLDQTCTLEGNSGVIANADYSDVSITCENNQLPTYAVGGTISNLNGSLELKINDGTPQTFTGENFNFSDVGISGAEFSVTVVSTPASQDCDVTNGTGTLGNENVSNVAISCSLKKLNITGDIAGHTGTTQVSLLVDNSVVATQTVQQNQSNFAFSPIDYGSNYSFDVTPASGQKCLFSNTGTGELLADLPIDVTCTELDKFLISGALTDLARGDIEIKLSNGGVEVERKTFSSPGAIVFDTGFLSGEEYALEIVSTPDTQNCSIDIADAGTITEDVTNLLVDCDDVPQYIVTTSIGDLFGTDSVTVKINGGSPITFGSNHSESIQVYEGQPFSFEVSGIPARYSGCNLTNESISEVTQVISATIDCPLITRVASGSVVGTLKSSPLTITASIDGVTVEETTLTSTTTFQFDEVPNGTFQLKVNNANKNYCHISPPSGTNSGKISNIDITCDDSLLLTSLNMQNSLYDCVSDGGFWIFVDEVNSSLNCSNRGISSLSGIEALTHLTDLDLSSNSLSDNDFDSLNDPIFSLGSTLVLNVNFNYDIRLTDNCNRIENEFINAKTSQLNCAGPNRDLSISLDINGGAANYISDVGDIALKNLRKRGYKTDTVVDIDPVDFPFFFDPVRDGSEATFNFNDVRPSLNCSPSVSPSTNINGNTITFNGDLDVTISCQAKQSVDINVTLEGGGYDDSGRENESVSGIELVYPKVAVPFNDANMSSKVGDDWLPGQNITFFDFPANEEHVSVWPGYGSSNSFSAPTGVYCEESIELTVDNGNRNFVLPCRQHTLQEKILPPLEVSTDTSLFADNRQYYALSVDTELSDFELSFPINTDRNLNFTLSQQTFTATPSPNANFIDPPLHQVFNVLADTQTLTPSAEELEGFTQPGEYLVGMLNNSSSSPITVDLKVQLNGALSEQATFRPLIEAGQLTQTWGTTQGNNTNPSSRLNDHAYDLEIKSSGGSNFEKSGAFVKITVTTASVDAYLLLTRQGSSQIIALNDYADIHSRATIFRALEPGNYKIYVSTFSATTSTEQFTLTVDSSMPAFTTLN